MKVIQVIPYYSVGGAEIMVENLCYELKNLGCDVVAVSLFDGHTEITDRMEKGGIRVEFFRKKMGFDLSQVKKLYKFFKKEKPDVVHSHLNSITYAAIAAHMAGIPVKIHTIHSIASKEAGKIQRKLNKFFFNCLGVVPVSLSEQVQKTVIEEYEINEAQSPIIFNGMPLEKYQPKKDYAINKNAKIVHVGRFCEAKNHEGLIKAFKCVCDVYPDAILNLFGTGELEDKIKDLVKAEGLSDNVVFTGVSNNISKEMIKNDIFCLSSNCEGIPLTLIEAMASAMPIVATNVGGIPDMIENAKEGYLTNNSIDELANAVLELINHEETRREYGSNALKRCKDFSALNMAKKYYELYTIMR